MILVMIHVRYDFYFHKKLIMNNAKIITQAQALIEIN